MIIDTHCHIDMLSNPEAYLLEKENSMDITIGMTNLPRHYLLGRLHFKKLKKSRLALGFHPQLVYGNEGELENFKRLIHTTSYIGEVGLDFSRRFLETRDLQIRCFDYICSCLKDTRKIISVHSRGAEREVLDILKKYDISNVIFHWYSGQLSLIDEIVDCGYYFSINEYMTLSKKGLSIINKVPTHRLLTETDAPFNKKSSISNAINNLGLDSEIVSKNFFNLVNGIR